MGTVQTFGFERTKEIFHGCVIVRAARTGHGRLKVVFFAQVEVCRGSVLRSLVTVEGESISDLFCNQGVPDCLCNQRSRHVASNAISQYHSPTKIDDCTHIQHTSRCWNISDVRCPESVGIALFKGTMQQIRNRFCLYYSQIELSHPITGRQVTLRFLTPFPFIASRQGNDGGFHPPNPWPGGASGIARSDTCGATMRVPRFSPSPLLRFALIACFI